MSILFLVYSPFGLLFTLPLLGATLRWFYYNKKDHYKVYINAKKLVITQGLNKKQLINADLKNIRSVYIVILRKSHYNEFDDATVYENKNELIIETLSDKIVVTNSLIDSEQVFIKNTILEWVNQHRQTIPLDDEKTLFFDR